MKRSIFLFIVFLASLSYAEESTITADHLEQDGAVYNATGSVVYRKGEAVMKADNATYDRDTEELVADGNVFYEDPDKTINAQSAYLNLKNDTGVIYDAEVLFRLDNYRIKGGEMHQTGKDRYFLRSAVLTTCNPPRPAWCISGRDVDIIVGDRLKTRHATMQIRDVPVLYTPYLWTPILRERKTGLLFPSFGYRQSTGYYFKQPFYWNIAENKDATFFLDIHSELGPGEGGQYRYLYKNDSGTIDVYHAGDNDADRDFYTLEASHKHGGRVSGFYDINFASEKDFYRIYETSIEKSSKRYLESDMEISAPVGRAKFYVLGRYFLDLKDGVKQSSVLQRLPEAGIYVSPVSAGPIVLSASASAANFYRESSVQPQGQRIYLDIKASNSIGTGIVLSQTAVYKKALYGLETESIDRDIIDYQARLGVIASKRYGKMEHSFEPLLSYRIVEPGPVQPPPVLDNVELIRQSSRLEAVLLNRLLDRQSELVTLRVTGAYDFLNLDRPVTPVVLDLFAQKLLTLRAGASYDVYDEEIISANSEVGFNIWRFSFTGGQNYARGIGITLYTAGIAYNEPGLALTSRMLYDPNEEIAKEISGGLALNRQCWGFSVSAVKRPDDYGVYFAVSLMGIASMDTSSYQMQNM